MKRRIDCHGLYVMLIVLASYLKEWGRKNLLKGPWTAVEHLQSSSTIMLDFFLSLTSMRSRFIYTRRCLICNKLPCSKLIVAWEEWLSELFHGSNNKMKELIRNASPLSHVWVHKIIDERWVKSMNATLNKANMHSIILWVVNQ